MTVEKYIKEELNILRKYLGSYRNIQNYTKNDIKDRNIDAENRSYFQKYPEIKEHIKRDAIIDILTSK